MDNILDGCLTWGREGFGKRIDVGGKPGGGRRTSEQSCQSIVPSALQHRCAGTGDIAAEDNTGVIVHVVDQPEVEHDVWAEPGSLQLAEDASKVVDLIGADAVVRERKSFVEYFLTAEKLRKSAQRGVGRAFTVVGKDILQRCKILAVDQAAQFLRERVTRVERFDQTAEKTCVADLKPLASGSGGEGFGSERNDLGIRTNTRRAQQFYTSLAHLCPGPEDILQIAEAAGDGAVDLRRSDTGDGCGHIGTQRDEFARTLGEDEQLRLRHGKAAQQYIVIFRNGCDNLTISARVKDT